jgi:aspartyl-tRNA(Asn)/glutamyl-tRNA(Gln) amidotransferase subunit A
MTVQEIGQKLRSRKISCVELIQETLSQIKQRDQSNSLITTTEEQALAAAKQLDAELQNGHDRGPFHGVPVAYKDLFYTKGIRTTGGSQIYRNFIPDYNATVVERLTTAGAISIGKTNLHELAYGMTSKNPHYGFVLNPLDTKRIAGGSSGGSATLVAGGFLPMALGSDTGGSIRIPASYCGIIGLKPTYGRVSRYGVFPLAFSLDTVGPLGACVEDCALTMNVIAGPDGRDQSCVAVAVPEFNLPARQDLKGVHVGVPGNFYFDRVDSQVAMAVRVAIAELERLGATLHDIQVPDMNEANAAARIIQYSETAALYANYIDEKHFGSDVWALIQQGKMIAGHEYVNAQRLRTLFRRQMEALWQEVDLIVAPTTPVCAPLLEADTVTIKSEVEDTRIASTRLVRGINYLGEPALSMPCGTAMDGLPAGLQMIAAPFHEPELLQIAKTLEYATTEPRP